MALPPDIEIAQGATLRPIAEVAGGLGLSESDIELYGRYKAKIRLEAVKRFKDRPVGRLILVTAVTPTRSGEGKTTMAIGLAQALGRLGARNIVVLRQPSLGPVFGIKGGACGGGYAQVLPMEDINIHFTGDLHAIAAAHNLLASTLENHLYRGNPLGIDIHEIHWRRVIDIESRDLRSIVVGLGGRLGGVPHESGFEITAASEIAAIHALATDLMDLKRRLAEISVAFDVSGGLVTAGQLKAQGAMAVILKEAIKPNLVQTLEGTPAIIHGGPFANIAHGCPSLIALRMSLRLADYVISEPGFGAELGVEKFCDIAARVGGLRPDLAVVVATVRALKHHGGAGSKELRVPSVEMVLRGLPVLQKAVENVRMFGLGVVVCVNRFVGDAEDEVEAILGWCGERGVPAAVSEAVAKGGSGGVELARIVLDELAAGRSDPKFLYPLEMSVEEKVTKIARSMYGVSHVEFLPEARRALRKVEGLGLGGLPVCVAKTPLSLTDDANIRGLPPEGHALPVTGLKTFTGAGFIVVYCGDINTMPALPSSPASERMDIDEAGRITGLG